MEDVRLGERVKVVRIKRRLTQAEVAEVARVRPVDVSHLEKGALDDLTVAMMRRITAAIGMRIDLTPKWQSYDLDREMVGAHDALQGVVLRYLSRIPGWVAEGEVTYSIRREYGAIDILAWHAATRTLLIIELKTVLVDPADIRRKNDARRRLASEIAASRGWVPATVAVWVIFTDTTTNRARVAANAAILCSPATLDGRAMRSWLRRPNGSVDALSFWTEPKAVIRRRVRPTKAELAAKAEQAAKAAAAGAAKAEREARRADAAKAEREARRAGAAKGADAAKGA